MPGPLEWIDENIIQPANDLGETIVNTGGTVIDAATEMLNNVAATIGNVAGDVLRALGIDPDQLAEEFSELSETALDAFLNFLNSIKTMKEKVVAMAGPIATLRNASEGFENMITQAQWQAANMLRAAVSAVLNAIKGVGAALRYLADLLPDHNIRQIAINVNPQLASWLQL